MLDGCDGSERLICRELQLPVQSGDDGIPEATRSAGLQTKD